MKVTHRQSSQVPKSWKPSQSGALRNFTVLHIRESFFFLQIFYMLLVGIVFKRHSATIVSMATTGEIFVNNYQESKIFILLEVKKSIWHTLLDASRRVSIPGGKTKISLADSLSGSMSSLVVLIILSPTPIELTEAAPVDTDAHTVSPMGCCCSC